MFFNSTIQIVFGISILLTIAFAIVNAQEEDDNGDDDGEPVDPTIKFQGNSSNNIPSGTTDIFSTLSKLLPPREGDDMISISCRILPSIEGEDDDYDFFSCLPQSLPKVDVKVIGAEPPNIPGEYEDLMVKFLRGDILSGYNKGLITFAVSKDTPRDITADIKEELEEWEEILDSGPKMDIVDFESFNSSRDLVPSIYFKYFDKNAPKVGDGDRRLARTQTVYYNTGQYNTTNGEEIGTFFSEIKVYGKYKGISIEEDIIRSIIKHEIGHVLGFGHSTDSESLMYHELNSNKETDITLCESYVFGYLNYWNFFPKSEIESKIDEVCD